MKGYMLKISLRSFLALFISITSSFAFGQVSSIDFSYKEWSASPAPDINQLFRKASVLMLENNLVEAEPIVDELLISVGNNPQVQYLKGFLTLYYRKNHSASIPHFLIAASNVKRNSDLLSIESGVTLDVYYHLAEAYHYLGNYNEAESYYRKFIENSINNSVNKDLAKVHLEQCGIARKLISTPLDVDINLLPETVNTAAPDYAPIISASGGELYYTSRRNWPYVDLHDYISPIDSTFPEDVYHVFKDLGKDIWRTNENLKLNTPFYNEASISLSSNGGNLYVYSDSIGFGNIFESSYPKTDFKEITHVPQSLINSKKWETHFVLSEDSSMIVFSSFRKKGKGGRDLWMLYKNDDGNWSKPVNAGEVINTSEDEDSPFLSLDGKKLYYSTNGPESMGGFDIMVSTRISDREWSKGVNLGYPINNTGDDIFFSTTADGKEAYYSSFRANGKGDMDIYSIGLRTNEFEANVVTLHGGVINVTTDAEDLELEVRLMNTTKMEPVEIIVKRNEYFQVLEDCQEYELTYTNKLSGKMIYSEKISTKCDVKAEHLKRFYNNGQYWIDGIVADRLTGELINNPVIELVNRSFDELLTLLPSVEIGNFTSNKLYQFKPGDNLTVELKISAEGYQDEYFTVDTTLTDIGKINLQCGLSKEAEENFEQILASYIVYYDFDKSNIRNSEKEILEKVIQLMNENPKLKLNLSSHTDSRGSNEYNQRLSERRANSIMNYIKERITNPDRITSKGMGELNPVISCEAGCSNVEHQKNRRTIFELER